MATHTSLSSSSRAAAGPDVGIPGRPTVGSAGCTRQRVGLCQKEPAQGIRILCSGPSSHSELQGPLMPPQIPWVYSNGFPTRLSSTHIETSTALRREGLFPRPPPPANSEPCYFGEPFAPRAHTQDPRVPGLPPYKSKPVRVTGRHHSDQTRKPAGG